MSTRSELSKARKAIGRGRSDEALVVLWNLLEPARLTGDSAALGAIGVLAGEVARSSDANAREAERLLQALGRASPSAEPEPAGVEVAAPDEVWEPDLVDVNPEREDDQPYPESEGPEEDTAGGGATAAGEASQRRPRIPGWVVPVATLAIFVISILARLIDD